MTTEKEIDEALEDLFECAATDRFGVAEFKRRMRIVIQHAEPKAIEGALRELHTALCGVRQVGNIDGHGVIRRESVLDLVSQRIHSAAQADEAAPNPSDKQEQKSKRGFISKIP